MGPRTYIRGNKRLLNTQQNLKQLQWGRGLTSAETPRRCGCAYGPWALQWGRGLTSAETLTHSSLLSGFEAASMGPRTYIRGNWQMIRNRWTSQLASMGPRTYIRGNRAQFGCQGFAMNGFNGAADLHPRKQPLFRESVE